MLINFDDAVTASNLNPAQEFAVYYCDGLYANRAAVAARCPKAKLFGITVFGRTGKGIFACDCETGDLTPAQAEHWAAAQIALGVELICVYASYDVWVNQGLLAAIQALEQQHNVHVRKWVADYNGVASLVASWADADQYADPGPVDHNVAVANFFGTATPASTTGLLRFAGTFDADNGHWAVQGEPGQNVHFGGPNREAAAEIEVREGQGGGQWRIAGLPFNSGPLGA